MSALDYTSAGLPGTIWRWLTGPNVDSRKAYAGITAKWNALLAWGGDARAPEIAPLLARWRAFSAVWDSGDQDTEALQSIASDLQVAEGNAQRHGYDVPTVEVDDNLVAHLGPPVKKTDVREQLDPKAAPRAPSAVPTPHPSEGTGPKAAASAIDDAARKAQDKAKEKTEDPYLGAKAAGVGVLALGTLAATMAVKGDAAKAGAAVLGTIATAAAAWLAFSPSKPPEKKEKTA